MSGPEKGKTHSYGPMGSKLCPTDSRGLGRNQTGQACVVVREGDVRTVKRNNSWPILHFKYTPCPNVRCLLVWRFGDLAVWRWLDHPSPDVVGEVEQAHFGIYMAGRPDLAREQCIQQGMQLLVDDDAGVSGELRSQERHASLASIRICSTKAIVLWLARTPTWAAHGF